MTIRNASLTPFDFIFEPQGWVIEILSGEVCTTIAEHGDIWIDVYYAASNELLLVVAPSMDVFVDGGHEAHIRDFGTPDDAPFFQFENNSNEALVWIFEPERVCVSVAPGSTLVVDCEAENTRIELTRMTSGEWYVWVSQDHNVLIDGEVVHRGSKSILRHVAEGV